MAVLSIVNFPDPVLLQVGKPVGEEEFGLFIRKHFEYFYDLSERQPEKKSTDKIQFLYKKYPSPLFTDLLLINS